MKTNNADINSLIDKYFEGFTTLEEELLLRNYFQEKDIPKHLEIYKPMFQFFASKREQKRRIVFNWKTNTVIAVAACLMLLAGLQFIFNANKNSHEISIAYIDGKKYTDIEHIRAETLKSLDNISGNGDVYSTQIEAIELVFEND